MLKTEILDLVHEELLAVEIKCMCCRGSGSLQESEDSEPVECGECEGLGYRPTALGEEILSLILRHLPRHILDAIKQANVESK